MIRFYAPDIDNIAILSPEESGHAVRVLRRRTGDEIEVVDGLGGLYRCVITDDNPHGLMFDIVERKELPKIWKPFITIAVASTKNNDRMEWLVEKLVEVGVDRIVPLRCARSERKDIKRERLVKIAVAAMKQSLKAVMPQVEETMPIGTFLNEQANSGAQKFVGYCDDTTPRTLLSHALHAGCDVTVLIGPEGDFSPEEIEMARNAGFEPVTMGDNRLRTETAALVACDTIHIVNQLNEI